MNYDFVIKRGNRLPSLVSVLEDADGPVDLSGKTVKFFMRLVGSKTKKVNADATPDADQVGNKGKVTYAWAAADIDTAGIYEGEFEVTFSVGLKQTFPNDRFIVINIWDSMS